MILQPTAMNRMLLFLLLFPSLASGQVLRAKLIDFTPAKLGAPCGWRPEATTLQFVLLETTGGQKRGEKILVKFQCPRDKYDSVFVNQQSYKLTLYDPTTESESLQEADTWNMASAYRKKRLPRFWCRSVKRL